MLDKQPASADANPPYNLAAATAKMMWACALATTHVTVASTARGLELWSQLLRAPDAAPIQAPSVPVGEQEAAPSEPAADPAVPAPEAEAAAAAGAAPGEPNAFASYRSSGGHAAAQVTVGS